MYFVKEDERYLPLYEAKLFHQYDHRFATFEDADERALSAGNAHNMSADEKADPGAVVIPRYWVSRSRSQPPACWTRNFRSYAPPIRRSIHSPSWPAARSPENRQSYRRNGRGSSA